MVRHDSTTEKDLFSSARAFLVSYWTRRFLHTRVVLLARHDAVANGLMFSTFSPSQSYTNQAPTSDIADWLSLLLRYKDTLPPSNGFFAK